MDFEKTLRQFGLSDELISKVITVKTKDEYYWMVEHKDTEVIVYCAVNRNDLYDGKDLTLSDKIITNKTLFLRNKEMDNTLVIEEYINKHGDKETAYVVTSLKDSLCVYEK